MRKILEEITNNDIELIDKIINSKDFDFAYVHED